MITKTTRRASRPVAKRPVSASRTITAGTAITSGVRNRNYRPAPAQRGIAASTMAKLTPEQRVFAAQLQANARKMSKVMAATNTSNIAAKPEFIELLPLFVQKLLATEVLGSVAMTSRQQLIPFFKLKAENTKGETKKGDIFSTPFVNKQGMDPNFTGRVVKNEEVVGNTIAYIPVLPGSVTLEVIASGQSTKLIDNGDGTFVDEQGGATQVTINYATGLIEGTAKGATIGATYQYDNETVGPDADGNYGAKMGKLDFQLDEINLVATAHEVASYYSVYAAFAAQQEYGANMADMSKEAAISQLTAEINANAFNAIKEAAAFKPQFNWDASPVLSGAVVPSDYLNMFKLKLAQASASVYQATRLGMTPNKLIVGTSVAAFVTMLDGFQAANSEDAVGPYKLGTLDNFDVFVAPDYDPNEWVMNCKSNDIRKNTGLFGEYMPITTVDPLTLADLSVQTAAASMYDIQVINGALACSGKILGSF